jgi:ABC-type transport system substrate-binding protein
MQAFLKRGTILGMILAIGLVVAGACGGDETIVERTVEVPVTKIVTETETIIETREVEKIVKEQVEVTREVEKIVKEQVEVPVTKIVREQVVVTKIVEVMATPEATTDAPAAKASAILKTVFSATHETNVPWLTSTSSQHQLRPMQDTVFVVDRESGKDVCRLCTGWEISNNMKDWKITLDPNAEFHFGYGRVTPQDLIHTYAQITREDSLATDRGTWQRLTAALSKDFDSEADRAAFGLTHFEIVDENTLIYKLAGPEPELIFRFKSPAGNYLVINKKQWDAEGETAVQRKPAGTGSYQLKSRELGVGVFFERVENHWRHTAEFEELHMFLGSEPATRLAMLLTDEAHVADIPRDLHGQAINRGMNRVTSLLGGTGHSWYFNGMYFDAPADKVAEANAKPWGNVKVREALNRAINRKEVIDNLFGGRATVDMGIYFSPGHAGFVADNLKNFDRDYGYDPAKAKALLAEAGYSDGFSISICGYEYPGFPEQVQVGEAIAGYWDAIGLNTKFDTTEQAIISGRNRKLEGPCVLPAGPYPARPSILGTNFFLYPFANGGGTSQGFLDPRLTKLHDDIWASTDPDFRRAKMEEMGNLQWNEYMHIPMVDVKIELIVNPDVVERYPFPGAYSGWISDLEYIERVGGPA